MDIITGFFKDILIENMVGLSEPTRIQLKDGEKSS